MKETVRWRRHRQQPEQGFTLIEILVVILILAILAAVVVFAVQSLGGETAKTACKADYKTVENAAGAYAAQVGHYPKVGDNAAATPNGASIPGGLTAAMDGIYSLNTSQPGQTGGVSGPWVKDDPTNGGHYTITLSADGKGKVAVNDAAGVGQSNCNGVQ